MKSTFIASAIHPFGAAGARRFRGATRTSGAADARPFHGAAQTSGGADARRRHAVISMAWDQPREGLNLNRWVRAIKG